ncbi:hypothetical protein K0504_09645 [Neiella marina]|uniref:Uncharacterized protein n=1 Tax=Neiella holothuriorum TaxID=2870530 RepID=A0ABS7EG29_9GAMM|nr:hypothetical protein [Neiella holothuriorum]MBW8191299.1 hypothetical protein [Neiella holothuriorum]
MKRRLTKRNKSKLSKFFSDWKPNTGAMPNLKRVNICFGSLDIGCDEKTDKRILRNESPLDWDWLEPTGQYSIRRYQAA